MTTITQVIAGLTDPPDPATDTGDDYSDKAAITMTELKTMGDQINTWTGQANTVAGEVNTNATTATTKASEASASADAADASAIVAQGAANFVGLYSSLSGAKTAGISAEYQGAIWILNTNSADITADVPGISAKWTRAYGGGVIYPRTSNIEFVAEDNGKIFKITSGTFSQTFDAAATLGAGWSVTYWNAGTGLITLDPDSAELIDGASTKAVYTGNIVTIICDGSAFKTIVSAVPVGDVGVRVHTGNGYGAINTAIRRYTTTLYNNGSAVTYADSANNGALFTINETAIYEVAMFDGGGGSNIKYVFGASLNSTDLNDGLSTSTPAAEVIFYTMAYNETSAAFGSVGGASYTTRLNAGDLVRPHAGGTVYPKNDNPNTSWFSIRKVGIVV